MSSLPPPISALLRSATALALVGIVLLHGGLATQSKGEGTGSAADLYRQLGSTGLDAGKIFKIRDASLDREDIHFTFTDGTIAFMQEVDGKITGAVFVGEGEALILPPDQRERHSLALFTKAAVLSEKFSIAFLRFSDDRLLADLQPALRAPDYDTAFMMRYDALTKNLAQSDALRLLVACTRDRSVHVKPSVFLRARLNGEKLGLFDVRLDTSASEQVLVGQASFAKNERFYDLWISFPMRSVREATAPKDDDRKKPGDRFRSTAANAKTTPDAAHSYTYADPVSINSYKIQARIRPPSELAAEATLNMEINDSGDRTLLFELSRYLKVASVTWEQPGVDPVALEVIQNEALAGTQLARRGNDQVAVVFPRPLAASEKVVLHFSYAGDVLSDAGGGLMYVGARGIWYPNRGPWMSNFDLEFRAPEGVKVLATGKRVSEQVFQGEEITRWQSEQPIPMAGFNLGSYSSLRLRTGSTLVETYATRGMEKTFTQPRTPIPVLTKPGSRAPADLLPQFPPDPARNARAVAERSIRAIEFLSPRLGPFPYSSLALTQMPGISSFGWPGLVYLSSYSFLSRQERTSAVRNEATEIFFDRVIPAHETAHQWWGDAVFERSYRDEWLMEALANYSALLLLESEDPEQFRKVMQHYRGELAAESPFGLPMKDAGPVTLGVRLNSSKFPGAYEPIAYGRGTWLIHMLRTMLRDAALSATRATPGKKAANAQAPATGEDPDALFYSVLRGLQEKFRTKVMSTQDVRKAFETALPPSLYFEGKPSLDWFFEGWVNGTAMPRYELSHVKITTTAGRYAATASAMLRQKNAPDLLVTSVPIYAVDAAGNQVFIARIFADGEETPISFSVPAGTKTLAVDPFHTVLTMP